MDIYFRNPDYYVREAIESNAKNFSWDLGHVARKGIDILKWSKLFLHNVPGWKMLVVAIEGTAEYDATSRSVDEPLAVYPSWRMEDGFDALEDYCENPVAEDLFLCYSNDIELRFRPVRNQPHKVLIYDVPNMSRAESSGQLRRMLEIKRKYPAVEFIIHNTASFRLMFGMNFEGADFDPSMTAKRGSVVFPSGASRPEADWGDYPKWIHMLGYSIDQIRESISNRILFNIESVKWSSENYNKNIDFRLRATEGIDPDAKRTEYSYEEIREAWLTSSAAPRTLPLGPDDGYACDHCSLSKNCKYFREGMVCGVPKGNAVDLARMFGTRDAGIIIDGLLELTQIQTKRVQADLAEEEKTGERDIVTDKRLKDLFEAGVKTAKLIDPKLVGGGQTVNIGMVGGAAIISEQTPQELMASAVRSLEQSGVPRADITPRMIGGLLEGMASRGVAQRAIEAEAAGTTIIEHGES